MKKTNRLFLIAGLALLVLSCQKAEKYNGQEIRFTVSAEPSTKTVYGPYNNADPNSATQQEIHWVERDQIVIVSDKAVKRYNANQHYSVYDIVDINTDSPNKAKLENPASDPNGLVYDENYQGDSDYSFMAIYPASTEVVSNIASVFTFAGDTPEIPEDFYLFKIPGSQSMPVNKEIIIDDSGNVTIPADMSLAYMMAETTKKPWMAYHDYTPTITLQFFPAFTAFEVILTAAPAFEGESIALTSVDFIYGENIETTPSGGTDAKGHGQDEKKEWAGKVTYDGFRDYEPLVYTFPAGTAVEAGKTLTFTAFALPLRNDIKDNTGNPHNHLTLKFTLADGQVRTATLTNRESGLPISFDPYKKHRLYVLAVPGGFKMFATEAELLVEAHQESEDIIEF